MTIKTKSAKLARLKLIGGGRNKDKVQGNQHQELTELSPEEGVALLKAIIAFVNNKHDSREGKFWIYTNWNHKVFLNIVQLKRKITSVSCKWCLTASKLLRNHSKSSHTTKSRWVPTSSSIRFASNYSDGCHMILLLLENRTGNCGSKSSNRSLSRATTTCEALQERRQSAIGACRTKGYTRAA